MWDSGRYAWNWVDVVMSVLTGACELAVQGTSTVSSSLIACTCWWASVHSSNALAWKAIWAWMNSPSTNWNVSRGVECSKFKDGIHCAPNPGEVNLEVLCPFLLKCLHVILKCFGCSQSLNLHLLKVGLKLHRPDWGTDLPCTPCSIYFDNLHWFSCSRYTCDLGCVKDTVVTVWFNDSVFVHMRMHTCACVHMWYVYKYSWPEWWIRSSSCWLGPWSLLGPGFSALSPPSPQHHGWSSALPEKVMSSMKNFVLTTLPPALEYKVGGSHNIGM